MFKVTRRMLDLRYLFDEQNEKRLMAITRTCYETFCAAFEAKTRTSRSTDTPSSHIYPTF